MDELIRREVFECLHRTGGPANDGLLNLWVFSEAEMQTAIVLRRKSTAAHHRLHLLLAVPVERDLCADGAGVALGALKVELDPGIAGRSSVPVDEERTALVGDDRVERAGVPQVGERNGTAVVTICHADCLSDVDEFAGTVVDPHLFLLVAGETAAVEGRPVRRVADDGAVAARDFREIVPIAA